MDNASSPGVTVIPNSVIWSQGAVITMTTILTVVFILFCFFVYFMIIILKIFFSTSRVQDTARYILFTHMLINDTMYLLIAFLLYIVTLYFLYMPMILCYALQMLGVVTFRITPYNLGIMSLERYVAVCFPLRYAMLCTSRRIKISIGAMWVIGILPNFAELAVIKDYLKNRSAPVVCNRGANLINKLQNMIKTAFLIINFSLVGLIIIFTYVKVLLVARKIGSANTVASKAVKTVVLHAFQFLLCMMSFLSSATEANSDFEGYIRLANFIFFMCLPRFLSPFIFGLRDEALSSYMKQVIKFKYKKQIQ